jgi:hypothetical protein
MLFVSPEITGTPLSVSKYPVYMQDWFTDIAPER